jgi:hypothetical protein
VSIAGKTLLPIRYEEKNIFGAVYYRAFFFLAEFTIVKWHIPVSTCYYYPRGAVVRMLQDFGAVL